MIDNDKYPLIEEWELYFRRKDGKANRAKMAAAFHEFWMDRERDVMWVDGKVMLGGSLYTSPNAPSRGEVTTSNVVSFNRVAQDDLNGYPHDLICALTHSGNKYYFYSDGFCAHMFMMLGDLTHLGKLNNEKDYYLRDSRRGKNLL